MSRSAPSLAQALQSARPKKQTSQPSSADLVSQPQTERPFLIDLTAITVEERLRTVDPEAVDRLIQSIQDTGNKLLSPVVVRPVRETGKDREDVGRYLLVAGAHRLAAAKKLKWQMIPAFVRDLSSQDALLTEIDENLARKELTALERALCIKRRQELYAQDSGLGTHGGDRKSLHFKGKNQVLNFSTCSVSRKTANETSLSQASVRRALRIAKGLDPSVADSIKDTPLAKKEGDLYRLAGIADAETQKAEAQRLLVSSRPQFRKVGKTDGGYAHLMRAWSQASEQARDRFVKALPQLSPKSKE